MDVLTVTPILNVSNLQDGFAWFEKLGWPKRWDYDRHAADRFVERPLPRA